MKSRIIVSAIIEHNGKYLLGRKPKDIGPYPNTWHLLGGGVDIEKETLLQAIKREVKEEANIEITNIEPISFDEEDGVNKHNENIHYIFHVYKANYASLELKPNDDIEILQWFSKEEIKTIPLPTPSIKLFKKIGII